MDVHQFEHIKDIDVRPDPPGHRPVWIWFAVVDDEMYIISHLASKWWQAAVKTKHGFLTTDNTDYEVAFETPTHIDARIDAVLDSYQKRYGSDYVRNQVKLNPSLIYSLLKVTILKEVAHT